MILDILTISALIALYILRLTNKGKDIDVITNAMILILSVYIIVIRG